MLDWYGGYFAAKRIKNIWLLLITAICIGITSSILASLLIMLFNSVSVYQTMARIAVGIVLHPIITIISVLINRKRLTKQVVVESTEEEKVHRREQTIEIQRKMLEEKLNNH